MKEGLPSEFFDKMLEIKENLILYLRIKTFEKQCFEANEILLEQKHAYLSLWNKKKNHVLNTYRFWTK